MLWQIIKRYLWGPKKDDGIEVIQGLSPKDFSVVATPIRGIDRGKLVYGEHGLFITSSERGGPTANVKGEKHIELIIFAMIEVARQTRKHAKK